MYHFTTPSASALRPSASQAGFSLLEVLISAVVLAVAMLAHVSSSVAEHNWSQAQRARSEGLISATQFVERLRSDEDWDGLYARLRQRQLQAVVAGGSDPRLKDGRRALLPTAYYPDFVPSGDMTDFRVLIDVPAAALAVDPAGPKRLREDLAVPRFGLPADLNGDGVIDGLAHGADYAVLPVSITFRWVLPGKPPVELRMNAWIRGNR